MNINKTLAIAGLFTMISGSAFAATSSSQSAAGDEVSFGSPAVTIKPSKNVLIKYVAGTDATGSGFGSYVIGSAHSSGTKVYASSSGDTKIFMQDVTGSPSLNSIDITAPAVGESMNPSGWTAL